MARGYCVRGDQSFYPTLSPFDAVMIGTPNNGDISIPVQLGTTSNFNLIGNPYPSAINGYCFLNDPDNSAIRGAAYFWTHNTPIDFTGFTPGTAVYNYNVSDYVSFNLMGSVGTEIISI